MQLEVQFLSNVESEHFIIVMFTFIFFVLLLMSMVNS